jgi:hypothetical protein
LAISCSPIIKNPLITRLYCAPFGGWSGKKRIESAGTVS